MSGDESGPGPPAEEQDLHTRGGAMSVDVEQVTQDVHRVVLDDHPQVSEESITEELTDEEVEQSQSLQQGTLINVEYGDLTDQLSVEVPESREPQQHGECQGWVAIDRVTAWNSHLSIFSSMEDIPSQYKASWAWAWGQVLEKESTAETDIEKERALKWICFLPQALLRVPRRGGKAGRGAVNKRFCALARGHWEQIVTIWESDVKIAKGQG